VFTLPRLVFDRLAIPDLYDPDERPDWSITPCNRCGLSELFDAPSDLMRVVFPNLPAGENAQMQMFTAFCGACGGIQMVRSRRVEGSSESRSQAQMPEPAPAKKSWWQFWK